MVDLDVLVVGGGAIGGVTAALMTGHVRRVMVLDANAEHVERMRDPGLELDVLGERRTVKLDAYADPSELPAEPEFALVTLKAAYLQAALPGLRDRVETFVSLGNGLVQDRVASLVGDGAAAHRHGGVGRDQPGARASGADDARAVCHRRARRLGL